MEIYDLAGRLVRTVYEGADSSGEHERAWRGLGDDGGVVEPGIYVYRVQADTDAGRRQRSGIVSVAY